MSESQDYEEWDFFEEQLNATFDALERNMEAQAAFVESWSDAMDTEEIDEDAMAEGMEGYAKAYETWMNAAEKMLERSRNAASGEE
ncbi:MAG: poly(R)-hydroxyalkanoic acid synthase subunit, partial [Halobacteria archaeon]|nr:poly(R)-hydroxyalkanoic acid synthase subunit [Halobacteria archaeon]